MATKADLYTLRNQLSNFLYDPTPEQSAWRDKMWEEGRHNETLETSMQAEVELDYLEMQIEAIEAAEPSLGEKIVVNTLSNLPLAKSLKGAGISSLLGIAEEETLGLDETRKFQWMANKEGGQKYGNLEEIRPITKEIFEQDIKKLLADKTMTFEEFAKTNSDLTARYISQDKGKTWKLMKVDTESNLSLQPEIPAWRKEVSSFKSKEATEQGKKFDINVIGKTSTTEELTKGDRALNKAIEKEIKKDPSFDDKIQYYNYLTIEKGLTNPKEIAKKMKAFLPGKPTKMRGGGYVEAPVKGRRRDI